MIVSGSIKIPFSIFAEKRIDNWLRHSFIFAFCIVMPVDSSYVFVHHFLRIFIIRVISMLLPGFGKFPGTILTVTISIIDFFGVWSKFVYCFFFEMFRRSLIMTLVKYVSISSFILSIFFLYRFIKLFLFMPLSSFSQSPIRILKTPDTPFLALDSVMGQ